MIVALIGRNMIYKANIPEDGSGNYWLCDNNEKKLLNIEKRDEEWYVLGSNEAKIISPRTEDIEEHWTKIKSLDCIRLNKYELQFVALRNCRSPFVLYCMPSFENFIKLEINNSSEITIGSNPNNSIQFDNPLVKDKHARIFYSNGKLMIENYDEKFGSYINNKPVANFARLLFNGDTVFIMGLRIIIMGRSIFINNPLNSMKFNNEQFTVKENEQTISEYSEEDDTDADIYSDKDYFSRSPRIANIIEEEKVKIDPPPQMQSKEGMPFIYLIGSTLSMGAITAITCFNTIESLLSGKITFRDALPSILITLALLTSTILIPILNMRYEKKKKKKYENERQQKYKAYIGSKKKYIKNIMEKQRKILFDNYVSAEECNNIILTRNSRLWERKIEDDDFMNIRLGIGDLPLQIDVQYPGEQFTMEDDNLIDLVKTIGEESKILKDAPITISLCKKNVSALVATDERIVEKFMQNAIMQLITFQSYEDLKLIFLVKEDRKKKWEHMKMLPHVWDNEKQIRFFADTYNDMKDLSSYLEEEINARLEFDKDNDYRSFRPYYLIITDDYKMIRHLSIITAILGTKRNIGFSLFCITNDIMDLPNECQAFITLKGNNGAMFENELSSTNQRKFYFDTSYTFFFEKICKEISNIPIKYSGRGRTALPNSYTFLEMYDVGRIEQLNILERWRKNDSTTSLQAPIGIDTAGMPITLDIHEKFHGPHGLIAGSTGSGKSEFIITYILSLAVNYHPDDVNFILIDYKGGGLAGAFQKGDIKLPHLVGTITNIDTAGLQRSLASIKSELRRRQVMFNEARNNIDEGTIDIYKYQRLYHDGVVKTPIPHLLIICDEFAELKQQQQEFMDELISVARIGRSLGVHLILATQKPAGIVNEQIRSNSKFAICLKVQEKEDSYDVIKRPDAAELKKAGQFYMQVGNNEYFTLGLAAWCGALYYPSDVVKKKVDSSIKIISNIGSIIKQIDNSKKESLNNNGEQLTNIVRYISELAKEQGISREQLWIDSIPETIYIDDVRKKYSIANDEFEISPVIGEFDDPANQRQGPVHLNLSKGGNTIIYGNADSGKETLLGTIVYDTITNYFSDRVQMYLLDFGSEALKIFRGAPHVGDVILSADYEKLRRFFEMIQKEMKRRTQILSEYGGDYSLYVKKHPGEMPMIVSIVNNYEAFSENYENKYDDVFMSLTREGVKCGITFIITASSFNDIRYRLGQNFKQKIALQLNNADDFYNIFDNVGKLRPSNIFGRGLVKLEEIYEFQVAKICTPEDWGDHIKDKISEIKNSNLVCAKHVPILPEKVAFADIEEALGDSKNIPIGINSNTLEIATYNFKRDIVNIISGKNIDAPGEFILHLLEVLKKIEKIRVTVFDAEKIIHTQKANLNDEFKKFISEIYEKPNKDKENICIILGIDKFLNDVEDDFTGVIRQAEQLENYNFIVVDNFTRLKNHEYDDWYKEFVQKDNGIWVGNGVGGQYLISVNAYGNDALNNCGFSFGCIINQGEPTMVKLIGMQG